MSVHIKVVRGNHLRNVARVIQQDPFVEVYLQDPAAAAEEAEADAQLPPALLPASLLKRDAPKTTTPPRSKNNGNGFDPIKFSLEVQGSPGVAMPTTTAASSSRPGRGDPRRAAATRARTRTIIGGGRNPVWESQNNLKLNVPKPGCVLVFDVWDKEFTAKNRLIASGSLPLAAFDDSGLEDVSMTIDLYYGDVEAGELEVFITYDPPPAPIAAAAPEETDEARPPRPTEPPPRVRRRERLSPLQLLRLWVCGLVLLLLLIFLSTVVLVTTASVWHGVIIRLALQTVLIPVIGVAVFPSLLGSVGSWALHTFVLKYASGVRIIFGAIHILPWIRSDDYRTHLHIRVCAENFTLYNPPGLGFTPVFVSLKLLDLSFRVTWEDLWLAATLQSRRTPLRSDPGFHCTALIDVEKLEFDGLRLDFQASSKGLLNVNEITRCFAEADVRQRVPRLVPLASTSPGWPNMLEVHIVRGRNLLAMDSNGLSDPYGVIHLRRNTARTSVVPMSLDPLFPDPVFRLPCTDASTVLHVTFWDADFGKTSDFLGQWMTTVKWLVADPEKLRSVNGVDVDEKTGWITGWFPLGDRKWEGFGKRGDINMRLRWYYDPSFKAPPRERKKPKPLDLITENRLETTLRLGNLRAAELRLARIPVLYDLRALVIRDAKISIKDLFSKRKRAGKKARLMPASSSSVEATSPSYPDSQQPFLSFEDSGKSPAAASATSPPRRLLRFLYRSPAAPREPLETVFSEYEDEPPHAVADSPEKVAGKLPPATPGVTPRTVEEEQQPPPAAAPKKEEDYVIPDTRGDWEKRRYVSIPTMEWKRQLRPRHGDRGITTVRLVWQFLLGLGPKLAANRKLNLTLLGQSTGIFASLGDDLAGFFPKFANNFVRKARADREFLRAKFGGETQPEPEQDAVVRAVDGHDESFHEANVMSGVVHMRCGGKYIPSVAGRRWFNSKYTMWFTCEIRLTASNMYFRKARQGSRWKVVNLHQLIGMTEPNPIADNVATLVFRSGLLIQLTEAPSEAGTVRGALIAATAKAGDALGAVAPSQQTTARMRTLVQRAYGGGGATPPAPLPDAVSPGLNKSPSARGANIDNPSALQWSLAIKELSMQQRMLPNLMLLERDRAERDGRRPQPDVAEPRAASSAEWYDTDAEDTEPDSPTYRAAELAE